MQREELLDEPIITELEIQEYSARRRWPRWLLIVGAAVFITIIAWPAWAIFHTDWLWFKDLGYQKVFSTMLVTKVALGLTVGLLAAALIWLNFRWALRQSHEPSHIQEQTCAPSISMDNRFPRLTLPG